MRYARLSLGAWVGLFLVTGCGGGGGGDSSASDALWSGQYHEIAIAGPGAGAVITQVATKWGVASFDGAGAAAETLFINADGAAFGLPFPSDIDLAFAVAPDRTVTLSAFGSERARGRISSDGALAVMSSTPVGDGPSVRLFGRREGTYDPMPLSGSWRTAAVTYNPTIPRQGAVFGRITFDTDGNGTMLVGVNAEGTLSFPAASPLAYIVSADGGMSVDLGGGLVLEGGLVRGGDVILLAGAVSPGGNPSMFVLVREGGTPSLGDLGGLWFLAGWRYDILAGAFVGVFGTASADASGNVSATLTSNQEGVLTTLAPTVGSWELGAASVLTLTLGGGDKVEGGVAPGNDFIALAGGNTGGSNPTLFALLR